MKNKESGAERIAEALDLPIDALCDLPKVELIGKSHINVENFRGILDYDEDSVKINTTVGIIKIDGDGIFIDSITDDGLFLKGTFYRIEFV